MSDHPSPFYKGKLPVDERVGAGVAVVVVVVLGVPKRNFANPQYVNTI